MDLIRDIAGKVCRDSRKEHNHAQSCEFEIIEHRNPSFLRRSTRLRQPVRMPDVPQVGSRNIDLHQILKNLRFEIDQRRQA